MENIPKSGPFGNDWYAEQIQNRILDATHNENLYEYEKEPCPNCKKHKTYEGHDACIGELDGLANACCGHGDKVRAYVQFFDGTIVSGEDAIMLQIILKRNKFDITLEERISRLRGSVRHLEENKFEYFKKVSTQEKK